MSVNDAIHFTFHPAAPMVDEKTNKKFANSIIDILEVVAGVKDIEIVESSPLETLPENFLAKATALVGSVALLTHAGGYIQFIQSILEMKNNVDPSEFWSALNFWIFFAVGHPVLQPILWISDVLHGSPGPMVANLVPATFIAANVVAIAAISFSKEVRTNSFVFSHSSVLSFQCHGY
jgi:hypothetical protein